MKKFKFILEKKELLIILLLLSTLSIVTFLFYFQNLKNLPYADSISRLDIARKVVDNITPGMAQVGNVWLPLPQILMLPFIWNNYLWHTGIAGYLMSGGAFILGGLYVYRSAKLISNSVVASLCSLGIYALNINLLYLQTTAMSESIFLCSFAATMYYFLRWFEGRKMTHLMLAAVSISAMTTIRYEGLAVLLPAIPMVFVYSLIKDRNYHKAEGNVLVFSVLACLGFGLWTLYLTVIFGDPLYWKTYYATPQATGGAPAAFSQAKPFMAAVWQYFTSFTWMNGIIPTMYAMLGLVIMMISSLWKRSFIFVPLLLPLSIFLFMVLTLQRNTPIVQPNLDIASIVSGMTSEQTGFNIRYGLLLLPWVAIMTAYVFKIRFAVLKLLLFSVMGIQFYTYFYPNYTVIYQIPARIYDKPYNQFAEYMKKKYDGGKILISAGSMEDQIFATGFNYSTFIHEGTGKYWKESLDNPSRYAKWVVIDYGNNSDNVARHMNREDILGREYKLVYQEKQLQVWKKHKETYFIIK